MDFDIGLAYGKEHNTRILHTLNRKLASPKNCLRAPPKKLAKWYNKITTSELETEYNGLDNKSFTNGSYSARK